MGAAFIRHPRRRPCVRSGRSFLIRARPIKRSQPRGGGECSVASAARGFGDDAEVVVESSRVRRTDGQIFLVDLFGRSGTCVSYWGPLGRKWSRISCNHPPRGRDVMFLIWFLLLPSAASSGVLAGNSCSSFLVCFCAIHSFPSTDGCFWLSLLSLLSGSCYVAITLTVSPCDADPQEQKNCSASQPSTPLMWPECLFPSCQELNSEVLLTFNSGFWVLPGAISFCFVFKLSSVFLGVMVSLPV